MATPLTFLGESAAIGEVASRLTIVAETCFCISSRSGDIRADYPHGLFYADLRHLSQFEVLVDGRTPEHLSATVCDHVCAQTAARATAAEARHPLLLFRQRTLGARVREELTLHNYEHDDVDCEVEIRVDADFAGIFAVKEGARPDATASVVEVDERSIRFADASRATTTIAADRPMEVVEWRTLRFSARVPEAGVWRLCLEISFDGPAGSTAPDASDRSTARPDPDARWGTHVPVLHTSEVRLSHGYAASVRDVAALIIPHGPDRVIAAGVPWFLTLFGRDALLASWFALLADPALAVGVLRALARHQGERVDPDTEEEPGRIPHELRTGPAASRMPGGKGIYYGSADATPLFVMLVGELHRWGAPAADVERLLPHVDRALSWIDTHGDRDGDGFVEYERKTERGLVHQGWKDSWDAISYADGRLARPPIAPCEVQAYVYGAFRARAELADAFDGGRAAAEWRDRAHQLQRTFDEVFWLADRGSYAVALDGGKNAVDALASNAGHCLWTGLALPHRAAAIAAQLTGDELFSGWGVRTLAAPMGRFHPLSYHNGSVWPHDNAITAEGLRRYGFVAEAHRVIDGVLAASTFYGGHLPELFGGIRREDFAAPVDYAAASIPQAWAAGSVFSFVRTLLGLDPDVPHRTVTLEPRLPEWCRFLEITGIPMAGGAISVSATRDGVVHVDGVDTNVVVGPRVTSTD